MFGVKAFKVLFDSIVRNFKPWTGREVLFDDFATDLVLE
jgi:hypothetical protein